MYPLNPSRSTRVLPTLVSLSLVLALAPIAAPVHASPPSGGASEAYPNDAVVEWNQIALAATVTAGQGPVPTLKSMVLVQVAVHDAVNGITGEHETYLSTDAAPSDASPEAAAVAAAHYVLVNLFPLQATSLDTKLGESLDALGLEDDSGIGFGESSAEAVLSARADDGSTQAQFAYTAPGAGDPGVWVSVSPTVAAVLPGWGDVTPWVLQSGSQFRPDGPPALDSGRYARDYNEIQEIGSLTNSTRTSEQTEIAKFWVAAAAAIWNPLALQAIESQSLGLSDTARTLALLYVAGFDASVACWDAKYAFNFWRPMAAIRNGDVDGNDKTDGDSTWEPLVPTPPHPEYLSGHTSISSAMATVLASLFGDEPGVTLVATSPTNVGFTREWTRFDEGIEEVIDARVYSGIHFRTSDEEGARVGRMVAQFVLHHTMR